MLDWYTSHQAEVGTGLEWLLYFNGFLIASAFLYLLYDLGLWEIGLRRHAAVVRKELRVEQFPDAYFAMLAVQHIDPGEEAADIDVVGHDGV